MNRLNRKGALKAAIQAQLQSPFADPGTPTSHRKLRTEFLASPSTTQGNPMKLKLKLLTTTLLASAMFVGMGLTPAMAQGTNTSRIDRAQEAASDRIQQGLASGQITPSEARVLYRRDREIYLRENRFKSDGRATSQERQQLRSDLDGLHADIDRMMSNRNVVRESDDTPGIDNRQFNISQRIDEGVRSGRITRREAHRLQRRERNIAGHEARFKSDGVVTRQERRELRGELAALSDDVQRMMNNDRRGRR